jgi:hypothetical protein
MASSDEKPRPVAHPVNRGLPEDNNPGREHAAESTTQEAGANRDSLADDPERVAETPRRRSED